MKLVSLIEKPTIIVRDPKRFHHNSNGICAPKDYWWTYSWILQKICIVLLLLGRERFSINNFNEVRLLYARLGYVMLKVDVMGVLPSTHCHFCDHECVVPVWILYIMNREREKKIFMELIYLISDHLNLSSFFPCISNVSFHGWRRLYCFVLLNLKHFGYGSHHFSSATWGTSLALTSLAFFFCLTSALPLSLSIS